jgi:hypothetical protein
MGDVERVSGDDPPELTEVESVSGKGKSVKRTRPQCQGYYKLKVNLRGKTAHFHATFSLELVQRLGWAGIAVQRYKGTEHYFITEGTDIMLKEPTHDNGSTRWTADIGGLALPRTPLLKYGQLQVNFIGVWDAEKKIIDLTI